MSSFFKEGIDLRNEPKQSILGHGILNKVKGRKTIAKIPSFKLAP